VITQDQVKDLFEYRDGELYWKVSLSNIKAGTKTGCVNSNGYLQTTINGKNYRTHRLIFLMFYGWFPKCIDHKDNNPLNNKIDNLRPATIAENNWNRGINKNNTSGIKGVSWSKARNKWVVYIKINNKQKNIGGFDDLELAELVVTIAREKYHGAFANHGGVE
jgi:hypothetical protein